MASDKGWHVLAGLNKENTRDDIPNEYFGYEDKFPYAWDKPDSTYPGRYMNNDEPSRVYVNKARSAAWHNVLTNRWRKEARELRPGDGPIIARDVADSMRVRESTRGVIPNTINRLTFRRDLEAENLFQKEVSKRLPYIGIVGNGGVSIPVMGSWRDPQPFNPDATIAVKGIEVTAKRPTPKRKGN